VFDVLQERQFETHGDNGVKLIKSASPFELDEVIEIV
jgi:hypothetical protein